MPVEYSLLYHRPAPFDQCPKCGASPFDQMMRGMVHNWWRRFWRKPYCCVICYACKQIVGYEKP